MPALCLLLLQAQHIPILLAISYLCNRSELSKDSQCVAINTQHTQTTVLLLGSRNNVSFCMKQRSQPLRTVEKVKV